MRREIDALADDGRLLLIALMGGAEAGVDLGQIRRFSSVRAASRSESREPSLLPVSLHWLPGIQGYKRGRKLQPTFSLNRIAH